MSQQKIKPKVTDRKGEYRQTSQTVGKALKEGNLNTDTAAGDQGMFDPT